MNRRAELLRLAFALTAALGCTKVSTPSPVQTAPVAATPLAATPGSPVAATTADAGAATTADAGVAPAARVSTAEEREVARGIAVYYRVCGSCHEAMWRVPSGGTLSRTNRSEAAIRRQIRQGSGGSDVRGMPALSTEALPESDMPALLAYLRSVRIVAPL